MGKFSWQGFLFAPLILSDELLVRINESSRWLEWTTRFGDENKKENFFDDIRRFLISPIREKIFPLCGSKNCTRKTFDINTIDGGMPWFSGKEGAIASIVWIDLVVLDTFSLLVLKIAAEKDLEVADLYNLNRKVPSWFERYPSDNIAHWHINKVDNVNLKAWVESELLGLSESECRNTFGDTDWFGHSLPMAAFVGRPSFSKVTTDDHFINLLVGAPFDDDRYALCLAERQRLIDEQILQVYNNWLVGDLNNRILFYSIGDSESPLLKNLEKHYIYIAAVVFYQKIMLTFFLEKFLSVSNEKHCLEIHGIRKSILSFRRKFVCNKISTYPLGDKIYQFFSKNDNVQNLIDKVTQEIENSDNYQRLLLERRENFVLNFIAIFAALTLPITTVATIYGVDEKYIFDYGSSLWICSGLLTAVFLFLILFLNIYLRKEN